MTDLATPVQDAIPSLASPSLPPAHPLRQSLNDEVHARPPVALGAHERIFYLALTGTQHCQMAERAAISALFGELGVSHVIPDAANLEFDLCGTPDAQACIRGRLRVKVERHSEFTSWWFFEQVGPTTDFMHSPLDLFPADWIASLPGTTLVAMHIAVYSGPAPISVTEAAPHFAGNTLVGGEIADGKAQAFTDFRLTPDGITHLYVHNRQMGARQAGRIVQRLVEIETYRMMALLALPMARDILPELNACEAETMAVSRLIAEEPQPELDTHERDKQLQEHISTLSSRIEALSARSRSRFSAAEAYYDLVQRRIGELHEISRTGIQGFGEFMERRLSPAIRTCLTTAHRVEDLSTRVSRLGQLLQTRVEIAREEQNSRLLASMDKRARQQLRLQQTVEGLSVVAISYYSLGVLGYVFKGLHNLLHFEVETAIGISVPVVVALVAYHLHRLHHRLKD